MATAKTETLHKYKQRPYHEKPDKWERKIITRSLRHWAKIEVNKGDIDMYEGTYYKHVLELKELKEKQNELFTMLRDAKEDQAYAITLQITNIDMLINKIEQELIGVEPTDCRGGQCG